MCISPFLKKIVRMKNTDFQYMKVDCGKCQECLKRKAQQWAFRFNEQMKQCNVYKPLFLTLTYEDKYLAYINDDRPTLVKSDLQGFIKRLRQNERRKGNKLKLIYYGVGEYGGLNERPHYHVLLLNCSDERSITDAWYYGNIHFGTVEPASIAYVLKYAQKKITIINDERFKEFAVMSKKIGISYIENNLNIDYNKKNLKPFLTTEGGIKIPMPRYYKEKIFSKNERNRMNEKAASFYEEKNIKELERLKKKNIDPYKYELEKKRDYILKVEEKIKRSRNKI